MADTPVQEISGQGGDINLGGKIFGVGRWMIRKQHLNADVTTTASKGWRRRKRILSDWTFVCELPMNSLQLLDVAVLVLGGYTPGGIEVAVPIACQFKLGEANLQYTGTALVNLTSPVCDAQNVVSLQISGEGTGSLVGPVAI